MYLWIRLRQILHCGWNTIRHPEQDHRMLRKFWIVDDETTTWIGCTCGWCAWHKETD